MFMIQAGMPSLSQGVDSIRWKRRIARSGPRCSGICLPGARNENGQDITSGVSLRIEATVGRVLGPRHAIGLHDEDMPVAPVIVRDVGLRRHDVMNARDLRPRRVAIASASRRISSQQSLKRLAFGK